MAFPPFSKRGAPGTTKVPGPTVAGELDEPARARARRRLIGAAVLLVLGIIAFPVLFETQPRPVPVDIPMVIPSREGAAPLAPPQRPARTASGLVSEAPAASAATTSVPSTAPAGAVQAPAAVPTPAPKAAPPASRVASGVLAPAPAAASAAPPARQAAAEPSKGSPPPSPPPPSPAAAKAAPAPPAAPPAPTVADGKARFVVQVGAYADEASARTVRQRIERLGLKTYTQEVDVQGQRRIRVRIGPFETQQQAAKVLDTLKAANLPGAVLAL
jgi:DedD protein